MALYTSISSNTQRSALILSTYIVQYSAICRICVNAGQTPLPPPHPNPCSKCLSSWCATNAHGAISMLRMHYQCSGYATNAHDALPLLRVRYQCSRCTNVSINLPSSTVLMFSFTLRVRISVCVVRTPTNYPTSPTNYPTSPTNYPTSPTLSDSKN